jgi:hypothetical protein
MDMPLLIEEHNKLTSKDTFSGLRAAAKPGLLLSASRLRLV